MVSLASPVQRDFLEKGCEEIARLGYVPKMDRSSVLARDGFFAGSTEARVSAFREALMETETRAVFCARGGYGSNYILDGCETVVGGPKILLGSSDITSLQIFLWQRFGWVSFYGPMVASNFRHGDGGPHGYHLPSLLRALTETRQGWSLNLQAGSLAAGRAEGVLLGGCLTLIEATLGTPWELDTAGALLVIEDRGMKPYQVDRAFMHLKQAGKFRGAAGIILGDFPECDPPAGGETVRDIARRVLTSVVAPVVWGAPVGHTSRPALTLPLGVPARLTAPEGQDASAQLEILEPACVL